MMMRFNQRLATVPLAAAAAFCAVAALAGCGRSGPPRPTLDMSLVKQIRSELGEGGGGGASAGAAKGTPTGWATIKGAVRLTGSAPTMAVIPMPNNKDMCPANKYETLVVGPGGGIQDALIYLDTKIPDDSGDPEPLWTNPMYNLAANAGKPPEDLLPQQRQEVVFDQKGCRFLNHVFAMRVDQKLDIRNSDPFGHNTALKPQEGARPFDKTIPPGGNAIYEPGGAVKRPFPVACAIHPWMSANMLVCANPYFAVTDQNGAFEIQNLPTGVELEFRIWQQAGNIKTITLNGETVELKGGKLKRTLEKDEVWNIEINISEFPNA